MQHRADSCQHGAADEAGDIGRVRRRHRDDLLSRARALCEKLLSYASPLLLYAEEIDPHTGRHLGNFPQAFSHLALINAVMHLIREDERLAASASITCDLDPEPVATNLG